VKKRPEDFLFLAPQARAQRSGARLNEESASFRVALLHFALH
jgi:hypothetical protein